MYFDSDSLQRHYQFCWTLTGEQAEAYDLLQSALERFLRYPPTQAGSEHAYLRKIIRNAHIDRIRADANSVMHGTVALDNVVSLATEERLEQLIIDQDELAHIWPQMEVVEQQILFLWAVEGLSYSDIADELELPRGTLLAKIHRLRKRMEKDGDGEYAS